MYRKTRPNSGLTRVAILVAIFVSCLLIAVNRGSAREASRLRLATQDTVAPLVALMSRALRSIESVEQSFVDRAHIYKQNKALRAELTRYRERQVRYENLSMKVARYEAILGVDTETDAPLRKIAARAVGETNGPFVHALLINVGTDDDVQVGYPVVSAQGLVGHVIHTASGSARVLRLSDISSRIPVASARSGARAILTGDNTPRPKLSFISHDKDWQIGDRVISSGDDGALPHGLDVGVVVEKGRDKSSFKVELSTQDSVIDWVWVSPFAPFTRPDDSEEILDLPSYGAELTQANSEGAP